MKRQSGNVALIVLGVLLVLGGLVAFGLVQADAVNYSEEGTANTLGGVGLGAGALALIGGFALRKSKS